MNAYLDKSIITLICALLLVQFLFIPIELINEVRLYHQPILLLGLVVLLGILALKHESNIPKNLLTLFLSGLVVWQFISFGWAVHPSLIWTPAIGFLSYLLVYILASSLPPYILKSKAIHLTIFGILAINIFQVYAQLSHSLVVNDFRLTIDEIEGIPAFLRLNTNFLSAILVMYIPILVDLRRRLPWKVTTSVLIGLILLLVPIFNSRGSTLALLCVGTYYIVTRFDKSLFKKYVKIGIPSIGILLVFFIAIIDKKDQYLEQYNPLRTIIQDTGDDRIEIWKNTVNLISEQPKLGVGAGNWKTEILQFGLKDYKNGNPYLHAHNLWLQLMAELGIIGLLLLLSVLALALYYHQKKDIETLNLVPLLIGFCVLSSFYGIYEATPMYNSPYFLILFVYIGISARTEYQAIVNPNIAFSVILAAVLGFGIAVQTIRENNYMLGFLNISDKVDIRKELDAWNSKHSQWWYDFFRNKQILYFKSVKQWRIGDRLAAITTLEESLDVYPYDKQVWMQLGSMYMKTGQHQNATIAYQNCIELYPFDGSAFLEIAKIGAKLNDSILLTQGCKYYFDYIEPNLEIHYMDNLLDSNNKKVIQYWRVRCSQIDQYQELLDPNSKYNIDDSN